MASLGHNELTNRGLMTHIYQGTESSLVQVIASHVFSTNQWCGAVNCIPRNTRATLNAERPFGGLNLCIAPTNNIRCEYPLSYHVDKLGQSEGQTDKQTDAGDNNTPLALGTRGKNFIETWNKIHTISYKFELWQKKCDGPNLPIDPGCWWVPS